MSIQSAGREPGVPSEPGVATRANQLLAMLPDADIERLRPALEPVEMSARTMLYPASGRIDHAYFPLTGMASMVASSGDGMTVEAASVAHEGMTGLPLFLGSTSESLALVMQISGTAMRMRAATFMEEMDSRGALYGVMQRYTHFVMLAMAQTIVCNRLHSLASRAARWLLQSRDAVNGDEFGLTHEFFATMLGVHRPSVTLAAGTLQSAGIITYRRGHVTILDREALGDASCECYGQLRTEYDRLLGPA